MFFVRVAGVAHLADPVKWQTHAPAPQERILLSIRIAPSRLKPSSSNSPRAWFSKHWLRRSAPVTHQDQGFGHSAVMRFACGPGGIHRPRKPSVPQPVESSRALRLAQVLWLPGCDRSRGIVLTIRLQPHLAQAAGVANSLNFEAGSTPASIPRRWGQPTPGSDLFKPNRDPALAHQAREAIN